MIAAEIARTLGGAHRSGRWRSCRCPAHDDRSPSLSLRDGDRGVILRCWAGCDPRDVLAALVRLRLLAGGGSYTRPKPAPAQSDDAARRMAARQIWDRARDATGSPVVRYLASRYITAATPPVLRYAPSLRRPDGTCGPAMVARTDDLAGELIGIARTWLDRDAAGPLRRRRAGGSHRGGALARRGPANAARHAA